MNVPLFRPTLMVTVLALSLANASRLPVPPIPPAAPPIDDAPVPDKDAMSPTALANQHVSVTVENFRNQSKKSDPAAGFSPGSQYQDSVERKGIQTPGFLVTVPLTVVK
jgi:hypothetical protein